VGRVTRNEWSLQNDLALPLEFKGRVATRAGIDTGYGMSDNSFWKVDYQVGREFLHVSKPLLNSTFYSNYEGKNWHFSTDRLGYGGASLSVRPFGLPLGSDGLSPIASPGNPGVGGYFSPNHYLYQAVRLGNKGTVGNLKKLTYDASAFVGYQDMSRFGSNVVAGFQVMGDLTLTKTLNTVFGVMFNNAQAFDQTTVFFGLRKRL
jgi:hypothetical protein